MADVSVTVSADSSGVSTGLAKAQEAVNSFKESASDSINEVGGELTKAFAAGAVIESIKGLAEKFTDISKQSERFGESAETIQRVGQAAELSGSSFETVAKALDKVTVNAVQALQGNEKLSDAFHELGINAAEFVDLPMEEKLKALADGYVKAGSNAEALTARQLVLGRGSAELTDLLKQGSQGLAETFNNANVASQKTVDTIAEVTDRFISMFQTVKVWGADALAFLIDGAKSLGIELAAVTAYVENLSHGFKAAKEAYNDVLQAAADIQNDKENETATKQKEQRDQQGATAAEEANKEQIQNNLQDAKDAEDELKRLKEENAKKAEEAHIRSLTLAQREVEIHKELTDLQTAYLDARAKGDEKGEYEASNKAFDLKKELQTNLKEQKEAKDKAAREAVEQTKKVEEEKKQIEEKARREKLDADKAKIDNEGQLLEKAKNKLEDLKDEQSKHGISVDSLRAIGGGFAGVNYGATALTEKDKVGAEQIRLAKEQVKALERLVEVAREKERKDSASSAGNGAFNLS